ncbi:MAG: hypothetical protein J7L11_01395 [Thermoprotei archaeon]|nr:hypothetical protein [Thermoprotei archaeon]
MKRSYVERGLKILETFYSLSKLSPLIAKELFDLEEEEFKRRQVESVLFRKLVRKAYRRLTIR